MLTKFEAKYIRSAMSAEKIDNRLLSDIVIPGECGDSRIIAVLNVSVGNHLLKSNHNMLVFGDRKHRSDTTAGLLFQDCCSATHG